MEENTTDGGCPWYQDRGDGWCRKGHILTKNFNPEDYPKYDNYDAINVDKVKDIPFDYEETMGVPITFLDYWCPKQFEIVSDECVRPKINGKFKYRRVLVRRIS